jgi:hypothetical protein
MGRPVCYYHYLCLLFVEGVHLFLPPSLSRFCGMGGNLARFGNASWSSPSFATLSERRVYNVLCGSHDVPLSAYSFVALLNETASYILMQAFPPQLSLLHP